MKKLDFVTCGGHTDHSHVHNPITGCTVYVNNEPCRCNQSQETVRLHAKIRNRQLTEIELLEKIVVLLERIYEDMPTFNLVENKR